MSSPADDEDGAANSGAPADPDPALSYPRGNRLGIRHPRPTVVIVVAVVVVLAVAFAWRAIAPAEGRACSLAGIGGTPVRADPEAAFDAWWDAGGERTARAVSGLDGTTGAPVPSATSFERTSDRTWEWRYASDQFVLVEVDDTYAVSGVNRCGVIAS